ncbi:DUF3085 domain-containing protein [Shewanella algicola]|uniref:DUF3085 domain-containing protein n=1 Tax=Shewanella algicola TaxID=640633 RepID=UPI002493DDBF|nr:DUF3085 domain-containing protein [Shewanella algicola]
MATASITRKQAKALYDFCQENKQGEFGFAKDHGAYFYATTGNQEDGNFSNSIQYIKGCDPEQDETKLGDWYDNAREKCGGDDFGESFPIEWLHVFFTNEHFSNKRTFSVRFNKNSISLVS